MSEAKPATVFHPMQVSLEMSLRRSEACQIPEAVALRAYEVYCHLYGEQEALIDLKGRGCRGGFDVGELLGFLYARSFPKAEWAARVKEAWQKPPAPAPTPARPSR